MMGVADAMRQSTMTQCYDSSVAKIPAVAVLPPRSSAPEAPPGYHYYELKGHAYFLELVTGKPLALGSVESTSTISPIDPIDLEGTSSFVTPSAKKSRMRINEESSIVKKEIVKKEPVKKEPDIMGGDDDDDDDDNEVVYVRMVKKRRVEEVVEVIDDDEVVEEEVLEMDQSQETISDLPQTCDFAKKCLSDDESDGSDTMTSKDLLAESS